MGHSPEFKASVMRGIYKRTGLSPVFLAWIAQQWNDGDRPLRLWETN